MKAVTAFLLVLCCLAVSHAWSCTEGPRLSSNALQIDAGQGKVVAIDRYYYPYFLIGSTWQRLSTTRMRHVSVGKAGLWGTSTSYRVYKYVGGNFLYSSGLYMQKVDAGGDDQLVGVSTSSYRTYCLRSSIASNYSGVGTLSWTYLNTAMRYYSCGPLYGCWGVDTSYRVYVTKNMYPTNCYTSSWTQVSGESMTMVEVGSDGTVIGVTRTGKVYQRTGITTSRREGTSWVEIPICMPISHVSYDLGKLWMVTTSGLVMMCTS